MAAASQSGFVIREDGVYSHIWFLAAPEDIHPGFVEQILSLAGTCFDGWPGKGVIREWTTGEVLR